MRADLFNEGQAANDILDENSATAQNINHLINQSDVRRRQEVIQRCKQGNLLRRLLHRHLNHLNQIILLQPHHYK